MGDGDEADGGYRWESGYEKTWESLKEDAAGSMKATVDGLIQQAIRRQALLAQQRPTNRRLGIMRHLYVVVDMSRSMEQPDLKPSRLHCVVRLLYDFVENFFNENPISQLGLIVSRNKRAEKMVEMGANPKQLQSKLQQLLTMKPLGEPSVQLSLECALQTLKFVPQYSTREVLLIMSSLTTCDPNDVLRLTVPQLQAANVNVSVIGFGAEVHLFKRVCQLTAGRYSVLLDESHLRTLFKMLLVPPASGANTDACLIKMGFPLLKVDPDQMTPCLCHLQSDLKLAAPGATSQSASSDSGLAVSSRGYYCLQCGAKYCELPVDCVVCRLTLISAPLLARAFHHLFPVAAFDEAPDVPPSAATPADSPSPSPPPDALCAGCHQPLRTPNTATLTFRCPKCRHFFCAVCNSFIHEVLNSCPECAGSLDCLPDKPA